MGSRKRKINVCLNCGRKLSGQEFLPNSKNLAQQIALTYDPVAGRFLCPDCNYSGVPIIINESDFKKYKFPNKKIKPPLSKSNPWTFRPIILLFIYIAAFWDIFTFNILSTSFGILITLIILIYISFKIPKYVDSNFKDEHKGFFNFLVFLGFLFMFLNLIF